MQHPIFNVIKSVHLTKISTLTKRPRFARKLIWTGLTVVILLNIVPIFHAYKFTHFTPNTGAHTEGVKKSKAQKIKTVLFGVNNPRPVHRRVPDQPYQTIKLKSNKEIEGWYIQAANPKGTVILFHGYSDDKSQLIDQSDIFHQLGYNTFLIDFMGSGGSEGNQTTIGYKEAMQVKTSYEYIRQQGESEIYLYGISMGSAAIMKAVYDYGLAPRGVILECPFGSMYQTVVARFKLMQLPSFPMAGLLVFWGGIENGFWAFRHNPIRYAEKINIPVLLIYGAQDPKVSREETDQIFQNIKGPKRLVIYEKAGHANYLEQYREAWTEDVQIFLQEGK